MTSVPSSPSGLDRADRIRCRALVVQAAQLGHENRDEIHYTQGSKRWDGITNHKNPQRGEVPSQADCSSFCTWALWSGLRLVFLLPDKVNGLDWKAGYSGTLLDHGAKVPPTEHKLQGDLVFYGSPVSHVAIVVARVNGVLMVVSHGSEGGPFYVRYNYRTPAQFRRYI
jgi:cell wall-associated NlpC family hydrolase